AHVDDLDAEVLRGTIRRGDQRIGEFGARARHDFLQRPRVDRGTQAFAHDRTQALLGTRLVTADGGVELRRIRDAPLHEEVDAHVLLLRREVALRSGVEGQDAAVEAQHLLDQRQLEMQARLELGLRDAAELEQDRDLALVHHERDTRRDEERRGGEQGWENAHQLPPFSNPAAACAGTTGSATVGAAFAAGDTGRYRRFLPADRSITFGVSATTCCRVSRYSRSRVTSGAARYSASIRVKRCASPCARATRSAL